MPKSKRLISKRGLISRTTISGTLPPPGEGPSEESLGFYLKEIGPREWTLTHEKNLQDDVEDLLAWYREEAEEIIRGAGADPAQWLTHCCSDVLDQVNLAAGVIKKIERVRWGISDAGCTHFALAEALRAGMLLQKATIAEHEPHIDTKRRQREAAGQRHKNKASVLAGRDRRILDEFRRRRSNTVSDISDTALMTDVGKKAGIGRSTALEILKRAKSSGQL